MLQHRVHNARDFVAQEYRLAGFRLGRLCCMYMYGCVRFLGFRALGL